MILNCDYDLWWSHRKVTNALTNKEKFLWFSAKMNNRKLSEGLTSVFNYLASQGIVVDTEDEF